MQGDARGEVRVEYENYTHQIGEKGEKEQVRIEDMPGKVLKVSSSGSFSGMNDGWQMILEIRYDIMCTVIGISTCW